MYLDNASTTPLSESTKQYIIQLLDEFGNPSSLHSVGQTTKKIITDTRKSVAKFINANTNDVYFICSGSASNTLGVKGYYQKNNCCVLYSPTAHKSILKCAKDYKNSHALKVDKLGFIQIEDLKEWLQVSKVKPFVVIEYANSEIGTIQDVKKIIDLVHFYNGIVYLDCTASISTIPLDVKALDIDMCGFSAHKLNALKGCGILYKKKNIELEPLVYGSQEQGLFGGTENVLSIASLDKAIEEHNYSSISSENRDYVYEFIVKNIYHSFLVGGLDSRLAHNLYVGFKGIEGESLMTLLNMNGIQVSTGSACNANNLEASATLSAIGMRQADIHSCIRITFSGKETKQELSSFCMTLKDCVSRLRKLNN